LASVCDQLVFVLLVARVDVDGHQRETDRRPLTKLVEQLEERPTVLAAREAHHHTVAVFDHLIIDNRLGGFPGQTRRELAAIAHGLMLNDCSQARVATTRAGMPTAIAAAGTFSRTTAAAPMTASGPTWTPSSTFAPAPIHTPSPMTTPVEVLDCASTALAGAEKS